MRLLFVTNVFPNPLEPTKGMFNQQLVSAISKEHEVHVVSPIAWTTEFCARRLGRSERHQVVDGVSVHYPRYYYSPKVLRRWYGQFFWRSIRRTVVRSLRDHQPDAIVGYWTHPDGEAAVRAARLIGVPAVVMVGGSDVLVLTAEKARRSRILQVLRSSDAVVAVSKHLRDTLLDLGVDSAKTHVVYRGVDLDRFSIGDRAEARRRLGLPGDKKLALWVGRMVPVKALDVLIDASRILRQRDVPHHLYLVGDGPLRGQLETRAATRGLSDTCTFVGPVAHHQLADWYRAVDVTVLPSRSEGVPNVLRESQACGTPFVASNVGGISEIADPACDRLVPPDDPQALADAVQHAFTAAFRPTTSTCHPCGWTESARELTEIVQRLRKQKATAVVPHTTSNGQFGLRRLARWSLAAIVPRRYLLVQGPRRDDTLGLTFDDGPHAEYTPRLLDTLRKNNIHATFFLVGRQVELYPELVRRIHAEGHAIGHHSFNHSRPETVSATSLLEEIRRTQRLFRDLLGNESSLFRPPWGKLTARKLWKLTTSGFRVVLWNVDPKDYACDSADEVRAWFSQRTLHGGDLVLMHDTHPHAAEVVDDIAAAAAERGLSFTTVDRWVK